MKTRLLALAALLTVSAILLSLAVPVNLSSLATAQSDTVLVADGDPGPNFPPPPPPPQH